MKDGIKVLGGGVLVVAALAAAGLVYVRTTRLSALGEPGALETRAARLARQFAIPERVRDRANPVMVSEEVRTDGLTHFADHCAGCHQNDGSGDTSLGRGLFPRPPDLRLPATQRLTDGELFHVIEEGIRFTGMPGFGDGTEAGAKASWELVHFIRHLPDLTAAEREQMQALNPRPPGEVRREIEEERFLLGLDDPLPAPAGPQDPGPGVHGGHE